MNSTRARARRSCLLTAKNRRQTAFSQQYARERASPAASLAAADRLYVPCRTEFVATSFYPPHVPTTRHVLLEEIMCSKLTRLTTSLALGAAVFTASAGLSFAGPFGGAAFGGFGQSAGFSRPSFAAAPAVKSGTISCTSYGLCKPVVCPRGKKSDGTCW
jgi:hypothetical protein